MPVCWCCGGVNIHSTCMHKHGRLLAADVLYCDCAAGVWKVDPYASLVSLKRLNANNLIPRGRFSLARFGDVRATCILNSIAEQCGVPGCEKMVLSLQVCVSGLAGLLCLA